MKRNEQQGRNSQTSHDPNEVEGEWSEWSEDEAAALCAAAEVETERRDTQPKTELGVRDSE